ncbi:hypothetical protein EG329_011393 [Mollisiaceae sp. DMI_Dod_QoI]|nr:hypothetical protein EG329_011393 [Helotiales sp. DMI_Dod_QoI]
MDKMDDGRQSLILTLWREKRVVSIAFFIAYCSFQTGFDMAAISGFQSVPGFLAIFGYVDPDEQNGYNISTKVQTLIQSLMCVGNLVASLFIFAYGSTLSRRLGLWLAALCSILAISLQIFTTNLSALYVGRVILGISGGFFGTYSLTYMSEIAPTHLRGPIIGLVSLQGSLGALIGILVDNYTQTISSRLSYQIPLAIMYLLPIIIGIGLFFIPDSPRYYVSISRPDLAYSSIRRLRGITDSTVLSSLVAEIEKGWQAELEINSSTSLKDIFMGHNLRRTLLSTGCAVAQTGSGMMFLASYAVYFYVQARVGNPFKWVMISISIGLTGNMLSFPLSRRVPRRVLLMTSTFLNSSLMFVMAIVYTLSAPKSATAGKVLVSLNILITWIYGSAQGPVLWALGTEIPCQRLRAQTVGFGMGVSSLVIWLCVYCSPYFINPEYLGWGPKYFYVWGTAGYITTLWVFLFMPETKGRSLEDLDELFERSVNARAFGKHVVEGRGEVQVLAVPAGGEKEDGGKAGEVVFVERID